MVEQGSTTLKIYGSTYFFDLSAVKRHRIIFFFALNEIKNLLQMQLYRPL